MPPRKAALVAPEAATEALGDVVVGNINAAGVFIGDDGKPLGLIARLTKIIYGLPDVQPEGTNTHFNYKFISDKQVLGLLRPRLSRQGILVVPQIIEENEPIPMTTARGGKSNMTRIKVTFRVSCAFTGEFIDGQALGYGDDGGDKGANKAYTAALKNFLIKLCLIGGDRDIEEDAETDKRAAARDSGAPIVDRVVVGDATVEGVKRGGRSERATDAQVARVGQYVRDLGMTPEGLAGLIDRTLGDNLELSEKPWDDVKAYLEGMTGPDIGKLIAALDSLLNPVPEDSGSSAT